MIINVDHNIDQAAVRAAKIYSDKGIFIYPTDTIYGFGGDPFEASVITRINLIKRRDKSKQFILLISSLDKLSKYVENLTTSQEQFLKKIWPSPVSVILKLKQELQKTYNSKYIAFRIPDNKFCLQMLSITGKPLISTSVNLSKDRPISDYQDIIENFKTDVDAIFYTDRKPGKIASTLISLTGEKPVLIREGIINFVELLAKFN